VNVLRSDRPELLSEEELAYSAIDLVSVYALFACVVLLNFQSFTTENNVTAWQWQYLFGSFALWATGSYFALTKSLDTAFVPLNIFNLVFPFLINKDISQPWTSYGLVSVIAMVYFTGVAKPQYWLILIWIPVIGQVFAARQSLTSISDAKDLALLGSYFSSLWILIVGLFLRRVRRLFLETTQQIDAQIDKLTGDLDLRNKNIRRLNFRDYENLQLHGTILNTLLVIRNTPALLANRSQASQMLKADYEALISDQGSARHMPLSEQITTEFNRFSHRRLTIDFVNFTDLKAAPRIKDLLRESIREILLNLEKHTVASQAIVSLRDRGKGIYVLEVREDTLINENAKSEIELIDEAKSSLSLKRLVSGLEAEWNVSASEADGWLLHEIIFDSVPFQIDPISKIKSLRLVSTQVMADNYVGMTIIYGFLIMPALFWLGGFSLPNMIFCSALALGSLSLRLDSKRELFGILASLISLSVIPAAIFSTPTCFELQTLPWLFNGILGTIFSGSITTESRFLKWAPGLGLLAESTALSYFLPSSCSQLLIGSAPGVALILISAFIIGILRNKNIQRDNRAALSISDTKQSLRSAEMQLEHARKKIFANIESFISEIETVEISPKDFHQRIDHEMLKLRSYLICSEHFENEFIREFYRTIEKRDQAGVSTKLQILGSGEFEIDENDYREFLHTIGDPDIEHMEIDLINLKKPEIRCKVHAKDFETFSSKLRNAELITLIEVL
jgi:hypothetical protein